MRVKMWPLMKKEAVLITVNIIKKVRNNFIEEDINTLRNIKALVEEGTQKSAYGNTTRIEHDKRFITNAKLEQKDSDILIYGKYKIIAIENYTDKSDFYIYLGVTNGTV